MRIYTDMELTGQPPSMCTYSSLLTYVSPSRLDDNGAPAAGLLLHLCHAFLGFLVGVVRCAYCNLVLDPSQTIQLNAPFTAKAKRKL